MSPELKNGLIDGAYDAFGFVVGGCVGLLVGRIFNFDLFAPGYSTGSMIAIALVGLGAGLGLRVLRNLRARSRNVSQP